MYEPFHQLEIWGENLKSTDDPVVHASLIVEVDTKLDNQVLLFFIPFFTLTYSNFYPGSQVNLLCDVNSLSFFSFFGSVV